MKLPGFNTGDSGWWKRAVFYQIPAAPDASAVDYNALAARLDAMQSIGIDALIVPAPALPAALPALPALPAASAEESIAAQATLDTFDNFTRQATARGIHVVLALPASRADADLAGRARFWLTRGVSGFRLVTPPETSPQQIAAITQAVRALGSGAMGERIVLSDLPRAMTDASDSAASAAAAATSRATSRREPAGRNSAGAQLQIESLIVEPASPSAAALRPLLSQALLEPGILLDVHPPAASHDESSAQSKLLAALALTTSSAALIDPAEALVLPASAPPAPEQESDKPAPPPTPAQPPPGVYLPYVPYVPTPHPQKRPTAPLAAPADPLTAWYGTLAALHHSNAALRSGSKVLLDFDAQNALVWVARPASPTPQNPPVFFICNLSSAPVTLSLADAVKKLGLHGFFLRTLLRSDQAMGAQDLNAVTLPPFGVFIGELRR